jgi:MFS family permease
VSARGRFVYNDRAWLAALCASELGTLLVFSNFSALVRILQKDWGLSNSEAELIVSFYQFGHIGAVMILATLTNYMPPRGIYLWSAFWTAVASLAFAFWAQGFLSAILLRAAGGLGLAGTYVPGMRMVAERFASGRRAVAMGRRTRARLGAALGRLGRVHVDLGLRAPRRRGAAGAAHGALQGVHARRLPIRGHLLRWRALDRRLDVRRVRLACDLQAPPRI